MSRLRKVISNVSSKKYAGLPTVSGKLSYLTEVTFFGVNRDSVEAYKYWESKAEDPLRVKVHIDKYPWEKLDVQT